MADPISGGTGDKELTDEQSFRQMVEALAQVRSEDKQRKIPRFPTPGALSGSLGIHGFEGSLVLEDFDFSDDVVAGWGENGIDGNGEGRTLGINIVDFCEAGVQLQFHCDDFLRLKESLLYLELQNHRFPVTLVWYLKSGSVSKGGFSFNTAIHTDLYLAHIVSILNTELVDFLVSTYRRNPDSFTRQAGVLIYMSIYYGLRLRYLEAVAEVNSLGSWDAADYPPTMQADIFQDTSSARYTDTYITEQISRHKSDPWLRKLLYKYLKPFYEFGCGITEIGQNLIFLKEDALATIFNSVLIAKEDCQYTTTILPSLSFLYQSFLQLKELLPGVLEEPEFDNQFRYYSNLISRVERLWEEIFVLPTASSENRDFFELREREA